MHGNSDTVGYNVPTPEYIAYIKDLIDPAIDAGVRAIFLEEPEFWAEAGWSPAFRAQWERHYGEPWAAPDSSVDAQYRASKLKYQLYFDALREVFQHIKSRAAERGIAIECHVPTHSMINYAHWRIVSPESKLMELEECDGYIAQVWTGTARTPNMYRGVLKERTFETAYFEYGQMLGMVRPTGRKVWFLADPIEDNPNYSWNNYRDNYERTIIASLLWPEVHRFQTMPWPNRIFKGSYPKVDLDTLSGEREGIPADYATQILTVINALNDMEQDEVELDAGSRGIGVLVSDSMMFQRADPHSSDAHLGSFYGIAMPLLKHGIPVEPVQLETSTAPGALDRYRALFLTYEGQKPLQRAYHDVLEEWVRAGGALIYVGDGSDPYHHVSAWWNRDGAERRKAYEDLFERFDIGVTAHNEPVAAGAGHVRVFAERPRRLQRYADGAERIVGLAREMLEARGETLRTQNYLKLRRGPYLIAAVLDESVSSEALRITGAYIDLFDPYLGVLQEREVAPDERVLLYDIGWARDQDRPARVLAAAARVRGETVTHDRIAFSLRGPAGVTCRARVLLPRAPEAVQAPGETELPIESEWDEESHTLLLTLENVARDVTIEVRF